MLDKKKFYINGQWINPIRSRACEVIDPSTEEPCAIISLGNKEDVNQAVSAAKNELLADSNGRKLCKLNAALKLAS